MNRRQLMVTPLTVPLIGVIRAVMSDRTPANLLGVRVDDVRAMWGEPDQIDDASHPDAFYRFPRVTIRIPNFWENRTIVYFSVAFPLIEVPYTESRKQTEKFVPADREPVAFGTTMNGNDTVFCYNSQHLKAALDGVADANDSLGWGAGEPGDFTIQPSPFDARPSTVPAVFVSIGIPDDIQQET